METHSSVRRHRIVFITSNTTWGGSEELWSASAAELAAAGHEITIFKEGIRDDAPRLTELRALGCRIHDLGRVPFLPAFVSAWIARFTIPYYGQQLVRLRFLLRYVLRPDLVVISQGGNLDGMFLAGICRRLGLRYVLIVQKASDMYWPHDLQLAKLRDIYSDALGCYFVSEHNRRLTEEQLGVELPRATIVRNPFLVPFTPRHDWPEQRDAMRLACVGRLYPKEKGQDLLLRVLARLKWRARPLSITFFGEGPNRAGLEEMAKHHRLTSVSFAGFVEDVSSIWNDHHGLVLASRCEGLPLVLVEAMLSGRVPIVTNVAGNGEVVTDDVTGFLASAATEDAVDEALERAWQRRDEWRAIGARAATHIRTLVPESPGAELAATLLRIANIGDAVPLLDEEPDAVASAM
jgi:glycosyltransferase involved in cell wall biosynthesis